MRKSAVRILTCRWLIIAATSCIARTAKVQYSSRPGSARLVKFPK